VGPRRGYPARHTVARDIAGPRIAAAVDGVTGVRNELRRPEPSAVRLDDQGPRAARRSTLPGFSSTRRWSTPYRASTTTSSTRAEILGHEDEVAGERLARPLHLVVEAERRRAAGRRDAPGVAIRGTVLDRRLVARIERIVSSG
jgi:hypothetical protein